MIRISSGRLMMAVCAMVLCAGSKTLAIDDAYWDRQENKVYFFQGRQYHRWTPGASKPDYEARTIGAEHWKGLAENGFDTIDAAYWDADKAKIYFFKGYRYLRWVPGEGVDKGYPKTIGVDGFKGLWTDGIDAAFWDGNEKKVYFFKGNQYLRWTPGANEPDFAPRAIGDKGHFEGLREVGFGTIDAAYWDAEKDKVYFFKGKRYLRWVPGKGIDEGYPKTIGVDGFKGLWTN